MSYRQRNNLHRDVWFNVGRVCHFCKVYEITKNYKEVKKLE